LTCYNILYYKNILKKPIYIYINKIRLYHVVDVCVYTERETEKTHCIMIIGYFARNQSATMHDNNHIRFNFIVFQD
jgi:methylmalonyl-CoA mutase N-terminal domain/subunit